MKINEEENFFSNNARSSQFEAFASDEPLDSAELQSKYTHITGPLDDQFVESSPWTTVEKSNDEPWELEDNMLRTTRADSPVDEINDSKTNYFFDSFNPVKEPDQTLSKSVRFNDNVQNIRASTPPASSLTMESTEVDITPSFNRMETSYVQINETDLIVSITIVNQGKSIGLFLD